MREKNYYNEPVKYVIVHCKCGKSMQFLRNHSMQCGHCGRIVYPTKECEFKEKMKIKLRRELNNE